MDCIGREIKEKDRGLWGETPGALSQCCFLWLLLPKENLHQRWLSSLRETNITPIFLDTCGHWNYMNWIYLVGESYLCIYLFTHEWKLSIWFINRSFKFKLAVSNHKSFILWKRKVQLKICTTSPGVIKYHQAISCSALETIRPNGEG